MYKAYSELINSTIAAAAGSNVHLMHTSGVRAMRAIKKEALRLLDDALARYRVVGLPTNIEFVRHCAKHPSFVEADLDINFIEKHKEKLLPSEQPATPPFVSAACALVQILEEVQGQELLASGSNDSNSPWASPALVGTRLGVEMGGRTRVLEFDGDTDVKVVYDVDGLAPSSFKMELENGTTMDVTGSFDADESRVSAIIDGQNFSATIVRAGHDFHVFCDASNSDANLEHEYIVKAKIRDVNDMSGAGGSLQVVTPMPGKVVKTHVQQGDSVEKGQALLILEAMKMEHVIKAPADAVIDLLPFAEGDFVEDGKVLVKFKEDD